LAESLHNNAFLALLGDPEKQFIFMPDFILKKSLIIKTSVKKTPLKEMTQYSSWHFVVAEVHVDSKQLCHVVVMFPTWGSKNWVDCIIPLLCSLDSQH
jgi:hypothetical protein